MLGGGRNDDVATHWGLIEREWQLRARCKSADPDIFQPNPDPAYPKPNALWYCNRCPVWESCLTWALGLPDLMGTFGRTSTHQRKQLRRAGNRLTCPGCASRLVVPLRGHEMCVACGVSWPVKPSADRAVSAAHGR